MYCVQLLLLLSRRLFLVSENRYYLLCTPSQCAPLSLSMGRSIRYLSEVDLLCNDLLLYKNAIYIV